MSKKLIVADHTRASYNSLPCKVVKSKILLDVVNQVALFCLGGTRPGRRVLTGGTGGGSWPSCGGTLVSLSGTGSGQVASTLGSRWSSGLPGRT